MATLVTTRVEVSDVREARIDGLTGSSSAVVLVRGDFLIGVDLSRARFESVDTAGRTAVLVLPRPRVQSPRLDHERTRVLALGDHGLWHIVPGGNEAEAAAVNQAMREAQRALSEAAENAETIESARARAERVFDSLFAVERWTLHVRWDD